MDTGRAAFVLLYALFWSGALARYGRYRAFATSLWGSSRRGQKKRFTLRFLSGVVWLNILPGVALVLLWRYLWPGATGSSQTDTSAIIAGIIAAFSFFAWTRFMAAFTATRKFYRVFYLEGEWKKILGGDHVEEGDSPDFLPHFLPGLGYLAIPIGVAFLVAWYA